MAKNAINLIKIHVAGGQANPAPPVGPALGQHGLNIMDFCKQFNSATQKHGTVRHLDGNTCRVGVMYNDNSVSQQFSENGGISYTVDYWTLNKTR